MVKIIQPSFARGEIAPALYGRVDTRAYQSSLRKARNMIVHQYGGISNRPGTYFIGPVKDHTKTVRLIPFKFKTTDTHIIEMGDGYMRFLRNDAHITEASKTITGATKANPCVVTTSAAHGYSDGDEVFISGVQGMTDISEQRFIVDVLTTTTFSLKDQVTGAAIDSTSFSTYTSGGAVSRIYEITTPYTEDELREIKFVQTADVITLSHPNHPTKELQRAGLTNWTLADIQFLPSIDSFGSDIDLSGGTGSATQYKVTAINANGEESLAFRNSDAGANISAITKANPAVVTCSSAHGFSNGDEVVLYNIVGMTELNKGHYTVANATSTTFELLGVDSSSLTTYSSGGIAHACYIASTTDTNVTISWDALSDAVRYRIFKLSQGVFGFIATTEGTSYKDPGNIVADTSDTPPKYFNPFLGTDSYPGAVGYHQQRRVLGGSNNEPDTSNFSVIGAFNNFSHSFPFQADDGFSMTLSSKEVNEIRHYVSLNDLLIFTSGQEWIVRNTNDRFSFDTAVQKPQSNWGSSQLPPLMIGNSVLFATGQGSAVRAIKYSLDIDGYATNEMSLLVPHMFRGYSIKEWAFARSADPIIYMVRNDGQLLTLTFNEEQEVIAWTSWDTFGNYESVAVIPPSSDDDIDVAYFVVARSINGNVVRYIERTNNRIFFDVRDAFFVDSGLTYDVPLSIETIDTANPVEITITGHGLSDGDQVDIFDIEWQIQSIGQGNFTAPTNLNGGRYVVANATTDTFTLQTLAGDDVDGTDFPTYVDGGTVRKAVSFISGLFHLKNTPVTVLADGNVISSLTVSANGTLTMPRRFSRLHIGIPYISDMETLNPEPSPTKTIQGYKKKISYITVRFDKSRGLLVGPDALHLQEMKQRAFENLGEPTELLTGDKEINIPGLSDTGGRLFFRQMNPLPLTILAIITEMEIGAG